MGRRVFWEGPKFLNYIQQFLTTSSVFFQGGAKNFSWGLRPFAALITGLHIRLTGHKNFISFYILKLFSGTKDPFFQWKSTNLQRALLN